MRTFLQFFQFTLIEGDSFIFFLPNCQGSSFIRKGTFIRKIRVLSSSTAVPHFSKVMGKEGQNVPDRLEQNH